MQFSGHRHIFDQQKFIKNAKKRELSFYKNCYHYYQPFLCKVFQISQNQLYLQNILHNLKQFSLLDIKIGFKRQWHQYSQQKNKKMKIKQIESLSYQNGFSFTGYKLVINGKQQTSQGKTLIQMNTKQNQNRILKNLISNKFDQIDFERKNKLCQFVKKLINTLQIINKHSFSSSSILIVKDLNNFRVKWIDFSNWSQNVNYDLQKGLQKLLNKIMLLE